MPKSKDTRNKIVKAKGKPAATQMDSYFKLPNQGLRSYFGNVVKGQSEVYDTPFAKGESTKDLISAWNETLVSINDRWPSLYDFEMDMAGKVGPLSVMLPLEERMGDIQAYYEGIHLPSQPIEVKAVKAVIAEWGGASTLRIRSPLATLEKMKKSTNSGSPYFTKKHNVMDETVPYQVRATGNIVYQRLPDFSGEACAVLGWRGQEGGYSKDDVKQRVVWMFPFAVNIDELRVYQPGIEYAQRRNLVPAWVSNYEVDKVMTQLFDTKGENDLVVATDFTKFDQHFNSSLQNAAKAIISTRFTYDSAMESWLEGTFPIKYMIPLCYNWGEFKFGAHGMGSGSGGTNFDETLAHRALQYEAAITKEVRLNPNSQCLGDDGVLTYPGITVEDVVRSYASHGLEMNDQKQYASTHDTVYLRRWHSKDYRVDGVCVGVYSTMRALGRMRYLERFMDPEVWSAEAVELRWYSILNNLEYHPLREQFVQFCMKRDKYALGLKIPHFLDNLNKITQEKIELMPDFLGWRASVSKSPANQYGIADWWIIKYLKSLR